MVSAVKVLALACAAFTLAAPSPAVETSASPIVRVDCAQNMGSAFRISGHRIVSVNHVLRNTGCTINGHPPVVTYSGTNDFAILDGDAGPYLKVDCGGFVRGRKYVALGYARGLYTLTAVELIATGETRAGLSILVGMLTVIPGQSGGPIVDAETLKVVGTVNAYDFKYGLSGSVALKDTPVCS